MSAPHRRRRDPTPMTQGWEIAIAGIGLGLILIALAALAGIGASAALFGGGWVWPHGTATITHTLAGLLTGHLGRGLPATEAHRVAGPAPTWSCVAVCELVLIVGGIAAGISITTRMRADGMATRRDAELVLGLSQLRDARTIIRPDLYATATAAKAPRRRAGLDRRKKTS